MTGARSQRTDVGDEPSPRPRSRVLEAVEAAAATARILVVDDDPSNVLLLETLLGKAGYCNVVGETDPRQALALLSADADVDLLLLDLQMPHIDGYEMLRRLAGERSQDDAFLPVIVLTADAQRETRERALRLGATDFLTKPFDHVEVLLRIRNLLQLRDMHRRVVGHRDQLAWEVTERTRDLARFREWLDDVVEPVVIHEPTSLRVLYANDAARTLLDAPASVDGSHLATVLDAPEVAAVRHCERDTASLLVPLSGGPRDAEVYYDVRVQRVLRDTDAEAIVVAARDATERRLIEAQLKTIAEREHAAATVARDVNRAKERFLTSLSHELRTPLTVVGGIAELLCTSASRLEPEQCLQLMQTLRRRVDDLGTLLLDLLAIATDDVADGCRRLDWTRVDVSVVAALGPGTSRIATELEEIELLVDARMLERAVGALVDNALVYAPEESRIDVTLQREADDVVLRVTDRGNGFPDDVRDRAFEPFTQGGNVRRDSPGPGIGLTLVRRFAELHGGSAEIETSGPCGSTVTVRLPVDA